jgi:rRNA maturation RNase YbeY
MPVSFHSENSPFQLKNKTKLKNWIHSVVLKEKQTPGEINFIFCDDKFLHKMNKEYLNHQTLTDIITFDYSEKGLISGDAFISVDRVKENAFLFKTTFEKELHRVMVHGVLHLLGYKDKSPTKKAQIRAKEDHYLKSL